MRFKGWGLGLTISGIVLIVFALVWLLAIFPAMAKLPADYHKVVNLEGTYQVMNSETGALDEIPVNVQREQLATDVQDNVLIINETVTCTHALVSMELPQFGMTSVLGVDRSTRANVSGYGDMERTGQFCFPAELEKESYFLWISSAGRPLEAKFIGEADLLVAEENSHPLRVFEFEINEPDLDIGTQAGTGLPQVLDIAISFKVDPVSGTTVDTESNSTYSVVPAPDMKVPYYISSVSFTEDTIAELADTATDARSLMLWCTLYGFWLVIGVGAALIVSGVVIAIRAK